jgi:hypothetical protein
MLLWRHQNAGQSHDIKIANRCFETVAHFKYLGTTATNENLMGEEIKRRLNTGNACYHSVQNILSSCLLSKIVKIGIYRTIGRSLCMLIKLPSTWCRAATFFIASGASLWQEIPTVKWMSNQPALWILLIVLYGCGTWSLTLKEGHRLKMFENMELRRIFGPKRYKETGGWRKLHNEDLHNLYPSPSIFRMVTQGGCEGQGMQHELGRRGKLVGYWLI